MRWHQERWLLIIAVLALVVWFALSAARRRGDGAQGSPEQVLKRHFANGEIDSATYERKLEELRK
ncbi:MAG: hypothetical protein MUO87_00720 [Thermoplasmata archaeon]|nr:hypothetical protein [Thermoplasmata archaeon]